VADPGPCEPSWHDVRLWEWGVKDVRVVLKRALSLELTVVERRTGAPVTQYAVICHSADPQSNRNTDLRLGGEHEGGHVTVDKVWRGKNVVQVMPLDRALLPGEMIEFEATDAGVTPIRVELDRLQRATVRASTAGGKPVSGSKVEVVKKGTQPFDAAAFVQESRTGNRGSSSDPKYRFHELICSAQTGADGRAEVFVPQGSSELVVRVTGAHPPAILDPAVFSTGQDLVVVVPEGGGITGKVTLVGYEPGRVSVALLRSDGQFRRDSPGEGALQGDGSFAIRGLEPGVYQLKLQYSTSFRTEHGSSGSAMPLPLAVPDVTVQAGRDTEVEIDASPVAPATVRGGLLVDGAPPAAARAFLWLERGIQFGQYVPDSGGAFLATGLPPGPWRAGIVLGDFTSGEGDRVVQDEAFTLAAGQELSREFAFLRQRLVVTIVQPDGKTPVVGLRLFANGERYHKQYITDDHGKLVFDPAPSGKIDLHPMSGGKLEVVEMPAGKVQHEVTVTFTPPPQSK
jgi:hypothetical protein